MDKLCTSKMHLNPKPKWIEDEWIDHEEISPNSWKLKSIVYKKQFSFTINFKLQFIINLYYLNS